ncbi:MULTISPECIES: putative quinol monooxygenase [unclassified Micromonospora]|uniref:putative quinol monooxygenase n=1 Tax=unclassified Micromonospora TaxID=2617518 RepID=UPI00363DC427
MVIIHGGIVVDPARTAEVDAAAVTFQKASRGEDGCLEYQLSWLAGSPAELRLLEIWESREKHQAHREAAHTVAWTSFIRGVAVAPASFTDLTTAD